ncbi:MAG: hypothetical protein AB7O79_07130 [Xanthobacteraceae bacterium]
MRCFLRRLLVAAVLWAASAAPAGAQPREVVATDFTVQLFMTEKGELSPDIFKLEELAVHNFTVSGKGFDGGKFSGFLLRVEFRAKGEKFAEGLQGQVLLREVKTKKVLRTLSFSDVYVGTGGVSYRAAFVQNLDCTIMQAELYSGGKRYTKELPFHCGK